VIDYATDDRDWNAIEAGLKDTDAEDPHGRYEHPLV